MSNENSETTTQVYKFFSQIFFRPFSYEYQTWKIWDRRCRILNIYLFQVCIDTSPRIEKHNKTLYVLTGTKFHLVNDIAYYTRNPFPRMKKTKQQKKKEPQHHRRQRRSNNWFVKCENSLSTTTVVETSPSFKMVQRIMKRGYTQPIWAREARERNLELWKKEHFLAGPGAGHEKRERWFVTTLVRWLRTPSHRFTFT